METIRKIYRSLRSFSYVTNIDVNGRSEVITFDGGCRATKTNGFFVTDKEAVQRALEALPQFNVDFYLEDTFHYEKAGRPQVPPTREVFVQQEPEPDVTAPESESPATPEPESSPEKTEQPKENNPFTEVTNAQQAKIQLLGLFPDDKTIIAELKKADEIRQFANEKGVVFPNWL